MKHTFFEIFNSSLWVNKRYEAEQSISLNLQAYETSHLLIHPRAPSCCSLCAGVAREPQSYLNFRAVFNLNLQCINTIAFQLNGAIVLFVLRIYISIIIYNYIIWEEGEGRAHGERLVSRRGNIIKKNTPTLSRDGCGKGGGRWQVFGFGVCLECYQSLPKQVPCICCRS